MLERAKKPSEQISITINYASLIKDIKKCQIKATRQLMLRWCTKCECTECGTLHSRLIEWAATRAVIIGTEELAS